MKMYLKYFSILVLFSLVFIGACPNIIEVENLDYNYIKERMNKLEYTYEEAFISKLDSLKRLPRKKVEDLLKEVILNPKDNDQLRESIFYAGILELKGLRKTISGIVSYDLYVPLSQYFYYCKVNVDKEKHLKYLEFYCDFSKMDLKDPYMPPLIFDGMYYSLFLLGWIFEKQSLDYLKSLDTSDMDGALSEIHFESIKRIEFFLKRYG